MEVDTPARIAILGAGPIGIEAALYARYLGYDVDVCERGRVGENLLQWGHVRLFTPFGMNSSTLGREALRAQDPSWKCPPADALLTGRQFVESYLAPLAASDLLAGSVHEGTSVISVGRAGALKADFVGQPQRAKRRFRLLVRDGEGQRAAKAHVVIDATGTYGGHKWLGHGGIPAVGESELEERIEYGLPDIEGAGQETYAGQQVLVVGCGYSAATSVVALASLAKRAGSTHVTWVTRGAALEEAQGPISILEGDRLPERRRLADEANRLAAGSPAVTWLPETTVSRLRWKNGRFTVNLRGKHKQKLKVDRVIGNVGYQPDGRLHRELQVHQCYASEGPMRLAAALLAAEGASASADCLDQRSQGPQSLVTTEPGFYVLGSKSYGRNSQFLLPIGLEQIREVFSLIGGRAGLNLYATMESGR